jgi:hypothetical protein
MELYDLYLAPKSIEEGCLVFHTDLFSYVFLNYPILHNDENLTITILQRVIYTWRLKDGSLPPILYLEHNNMFQSNKKNLLFSYLHMLVLKKAFKKMKVVFCFGHPHNQMIRLNF